MPITLCACTTFLLGRAEASPILITHTRKLLYLCMYVCMYVGIRHPRAHHALRICKRVSMRVHGLGKDCQHSPRVNSKCSLPITVIMRLWSCLVWHGRPLQEEEGLVNSLYRASTKGVQLATMLWCRVNHGWCSTIPLILSR